MGRIGLVHLEAITKAPGVKAVIVSNPTISKAEVCGVSAECINGEETFTARCNVLSDLFSPIELFLT